MYPQRETNLEGETDDAGEKVIGPKNTQYHIYIHTVCRSETGVGPCRLVAKVQHGRHEGLGFGLGLRQQLVSAGSGGIRTQRREPVLLHHVLVYLFYDTSKNKIEGSWGSPEREHLFCASCGHAGRVYRRISRLGFARRHFTCFQRRNQPSWMEPRRRDAEAAEYIGHPPWRGRGLCNFGPPSNHRTYSSRGGKGGEGACHSPAVKRRKMGR